MIIGLCGRIGSGKTTLAKICEKYGYKRLYIALPLKVLCADLLGISIDRLNEMKNDGSPIDFTLDNDFCKTLAEKTELPLDRIVSIALNKHIDNVRQLLQYVGTNVIRRINPDWHVQSVAKMMKEGQNYVIDDIRYPNEKRLIDQLGGDSWYIVRPKIDNVSNHTSETSLTFHHCWNKIIINNNNCDDFKKKWDVFMQNYENNVKEREVHIQNIIESGISDNICDKQISDSLLISKYLFQYVPKEYNFDEIEDLKLNDDNTLFIFYKTSKVEAIDNPLNIEEIKKYL